MRRRYKLQKESGRHHPGHLVSGSFGGLLDHVGHRVQVVYYGSGGKETADNVAVECVRCGQVLVDFEWEEP